MRSPKQLGSEISPNTTITGSGATNVYDVSAVQLLSSVTIILYVPALRPLASLLVDTLSVHIYVYGSVPPVVSTANSPLFSLQLTSCRSKESILVLRIIGFNNSIDRVTLQSLASVIIKSYSPAQRSIRIELLLLSSNHV